MFVILTAELVELILIIKTKENFEQSLFLYLDSKFSKEKQESV